MFIFKKKIRLKKKWRFWRTFKFFFLKKKKKTIFLKLKGFFYKKRIIKHQFISLYGKNLINSAFSKNQSKFAFDKKFLYLICALELRLNILVLRMFLNFNLLEVNSIINKGYITVNNKIRNKTYKVNVKDLITYSYAVFYLSKLNWSSVKKWYWFSWKKWIRKYKRKLSLNFFWNIKKFLIVNYTQTHYNIYSGILLRKPLLGEVLLSNYKRMLSKNLLKKIYTLY